MIKALIPLSEVGRRLNVTDPRTVVAACERHGVPLTEISRSVRGLTETNLELLLARASQAPEAATDAEMDAEMALLAFLRDLRRRSLLREQVKNRIRAARTAGGDTLPPKLVELLCAALEAQS